MLARLVVAALLSAACASELSSCGHCSCSECVATSTYGSAYSTWCANAAYHPGDCPADFCECDVTIAPPPSPSPPPSFVATCPVGGTTFSCGSNGSPTDFVLLVDTGAQFELEHSAELTELMTQIASSYTFDPAGAQWL